MSGGSFNYVYAKVREAADYTSDVEIKDLLVDLSEVLHDEEWAYSGDYQEETYIETLKKFKKKWFSESRNERLESYINNELNRCKKECYKIIGKEVQG